MSNDKIGANKVITIDFFDKLAQKTTLSDEEQSGFSPSYRTSTLEFEVDTITSHILKYSDGANLLDIGCGSGKFPKLLYPKLINKFQITGLDTEHQINAISKSLTLDNVLFTKNDLMKFGAFATIKYDVILLNSTFQYLIVENTIKNIIGKLVSLSKNNSLIYITDLPNYDLAETIFKENWRGKSKSNSGLIGNSEIKEMDYYFEINSFFRLNDLDSPCKNTRARLNMVWRKL